MAGERGWRFVGGTLPTAHQLRSALRSGRLIDQTGSAVEVTRASYRLVPYGGLYRSEDLLIGEDVLIAAGLIRENDGVLFPADGLREIAHASDADGCEALLAALLTRRVPLWLLAATASGVLEDELIPDEERTKLHEVLAPQAREALLLALGRRYSQEDRAATGAIVEEFVVTHCRAQLRSRGASDLADSVRRVSEISDQLGYDITAPRLDHSTRRIEAKGTRGAGPTVVFYLSRNEAERALADHDWSLVACRVAGDDAVVLVGHVSGPQLAPYLPHDPGPETRWQSIRLEVPESLFTDSLPPI
jgi:hypothetical protein